MTEQGTGEDLRDSDAASDPDTESGIDVVLVTGLSGAGRGTAAKVLEDLGWYVADNLPPNSSPGWSIWGWRRDRASPSWRW